MIIYDPKITGSFQINGSTISSVGEIDNLSGSVAALNNTSSSYLLNTTDVLNGNLTVTGTLTAQEFHTEYTSASIVYQSGSTKFGDSSDDVHQFTGNVGINTNSPVTALHTIGKIRAAKLENPSAYIQLSADELTSNYAADILLNDTGLTFKHNSNSRGFVFDRNGTTLMTISSAGHLVLSGGNLFVDSGTSYNDKGIIYLSNQRTAIISDIVNLTANGDTSLDFQTRSAGSLASSMFIDEFRRVGIGTNAPQVRLDYGNDVNQAFHLYSSGADYYGINMTQYDSQAYSTNIFSGNGGLIKFRTASGTSTQSTRMTIAANGNVGIGTTSPGEKLSVKGDTGLYGTTSGGVVTPANLVFYNSEGSNGIGDGTNIVNHNIGNIQFYGKDGSLNAAGLYSSIESYIVDANTLVQGSQNEGGRLDFNIWRHDVSTEPRVKYTAMTIDNFARVGIGTTSPSQTLDVVGDAIFSSYAGFNGVTSPEFPVDISAVDGGKILRSTRGTSVFRFDQTNDGPGYIGMQSNDDLSIQTDNTSKIYIKADGNVGINTTSPSAKLHVNGSQILNGDLIIPYSPSAVTNTIGVETSPTNPFSQTAKTLVIQGANAYQAGAATQAQAGGDVYIKGGYGVVNTGLGVYAGNVSIEGGTTNGGNSTGAGSVIFKTAAAERMNIAADGTIKLPYAFVTGGLNSGAGVITDPGSYTGMRLYGQGDGNLKIFNVRNNSAYGNIIFYTGNGSSEALRIAQNSNVGIGTTNPKAKLHIQGGVNYNNALIEKIGTKNGTGTYTLFTNGSTATQSSGTVEVHGIYGTPSTSAVWVYKISGNRTISLSYSDTTGYTGSTPVVSWNGDTLEVTNSNPSVYYSVCVRLYEIGNSWVPTWGNLPGISN